MQTLNFQFKETIKDLKMVCTDDQYFEITEIFQEYTNSLQTQKTSSSLLLMNVEDILGFAQIRAGKFSKNIKLFDIKKAVEEIMVIQQYKADSLNINMHCEFEGFDI